MNLNVIKYKNAMNKSQEKLWHTCCASKGICKVRFDLVWPPMPHFGRQYLFFIGKLQGKPLKHKGSAPMVQTLGGNTPACGLCHCAVSPFSWAFSTWYIWMDHDNFILSTMLGEASEDISCIYDLLVTYEERRWEASGDVRCVYGRWAHVS